MEIRGEDFIKKVQLKQEQNEIEQRLNEINEAQSVFEESIKEVDSTPNEPTLSKLDKEIEIQEEREYSDIMLGKTESNAQNKKKYLILGLILVILFLLTIIIIRLLTNETSSNDSFSSSQSQENEKILDNENIEEQYQKIINEKLKNIKEEKQKEAILEEKIEEKLNLEKIEEKEVIEEESKPLKTDIFDVKKTTPTYTPTKKVAKEEPVIKEVVKTKKTEPKEIFKQVQNKKPSSNVVTSKPKGTFIQIGAFSKTPNNQYLKNITKQGFSYKIYKVTINNKLYHKVLIGPYNSRGQAQLATDNIKKKLNVSGAFILKF